MTIKDAIRELHMLRDEYKDGEEPLCIGYAEEVLKMIAEAVTFTEAYWIRRNHAFFCTNCREECITEWNETGGEYALTKNCPHCGARMVNGDDGL